MDSIQSVNETVMDNFKENAIFICGHRKSGTTLLLSLFDNHPEVSVYPADSGFFFKYFPMSEINEYSAAEKIDLIMNTVIKNLEEELEKIPEQTKKEINFNIMKFKNEFRKLAEKSNATPKDMLISLAVSFKTNFINSTMRKYWIEKTSSTEIYANEVFQWFPKAKFVHIIRDPRDNWASLKSGWDQRYKNFSDSKERLIQSLIERGKLGMEFAKYNEKIFGKEKYKVLKFEDLTNEPEKTTKDLCNFLQIKFDETILKPTILGQPWKGNSFDGSEFTSISNVNASRWKERIDENEAKLIEYYFAEIMQYFGYELEYDLKERMEAAANHYKWFNFAERYSYSNTLKHII